MKFRDDLNNETVPVCLNSLKMIVDVTKPKMELKTDSGFILTVDNKRQLFVDSAPKNIGFETADTGSGIKSYKYGLKNNVAEVSAAEFGGSLSIDYNKEYYVAVEDVVGNIASETFIVAQPSEANKIEITNFSFTTPQESYTTDDIYKTGYTGNAKTDEVRYILPSRELGYHKNVLTLKFSIKHNIEDSIFTLKENGIWFDGFYADSAEIKVSEWSEDYRYGTWDDMPTTVLEYENIGGKTYLPISKADTEKIQTELENLKGTLKDVTKDEKENVLHITVTGHLNPRMGSSEYAATVYAGTNVYTASESVTKTYNFDMFGPRDISISSSDCTVQKKSDNEFYIYSENSEVNLNITAKDEFVHTFTDYGHFSHNADAVYFMIEDDENLYLNLEKENRYVTLTFAIGAAQSKNFRITAYDFFDNPTPVVIHWVNDKTPPNISYNVEGSNGSKKVRVSFTDDESGVSYFTYTKDSGSEQVVFGDELIIEPSEFGVYSFKAYNNLRGEAKANDVYIGTYKFEESKIVTEYVELYDPNNTTQGDSGSGYNDSLAALKMIKGIAYDSNLVPCITADYPTEYVRGDRNVSLYFALKDCDSNGLNDISKLELIYPSNSYMNSYSIPVKNRRQTQKYAVESINLDFAGESRGQKIILRVYSELGSIKDFEIPYPKVNKIPANISNLVTVKNDGTEVAYTTNSYGEDGYKILFPGAPNDCLQDHNVVITPKTNIADFVGVYDYVFVNNYVFSGKTEKTNVNKWNELQFKQTLQYWQSGNTYANIYFMDKLGNIMVIYLY